MAIRTVWIEEGCIMCNACEAECQEVFLVGDTSCQIRGEVRQDGALTENRDEKAPLKVELAASLEDGIRNAAAGCPVEVITFE